MPLRKCIESHTHREYLTWLAYIEEEWKEPNRTDFYLMQISQEMRRTVSKNPNRIKLEHFRLKFGTKQEKQRMDMEQSKSFWKQVLGIAKKKDGS